MYADLHTHSAFSDGTDSPVELVRLAARNGVSALAMADHDTTAGFEELSREAAKYGIEAVPAFELSTSKGGVRIHILGYFADRDNVSLQRFFRQVSEARTENTREIFNKLCKLGRLSYSWDAVLAHNPDSSWICSTHIFMAMKRDGCFEEPQDWKEFHRRNFSRESPAFTGMEGFASRDAIEAVLGAGGVPVVAHPGLIGDDSRVESLIDYGLMGIEAYYPAHDAAAVHRYLELARRNNLLVTGGTDWHGEFTEWGVPLGGCGLDKEGFDRLKNICKGR